MSYQKPKYKFDCFRKGHVPLPDTPSGIATLGGRPHAGHVCAKCKVVYYEELDEMPVIVAPKVSLV